MAEPLLRATRDLNTVLANIDANALSDFRLLEEVRRTMSSREEFASLQPEVISQAAVARFIQEFAKTKTKVYATQVRRVEKGLGVLDQDVRRQLETKLHNELRRRVPPVKELLADLEIHFVRDPAVEAVWRLLRSVLNDVWKRSFTITNRNGGHFYPVGFASRVCSTLYKLAPHQSPKPCLDYDSNMSQLALRRLLASNDESCKFSVSRCPAGFTAFGFPWSPQVSVRSAEDLPSAINPFEPESPEAMLLDLILGFQLVFHVGEGYIAEVDTTITVDGKEISETENHKNRLTKVNEAFLKLWGWEPSEELGDPARKSLNELTDNLGLGGDEDSTTWSKEHEREYQAATRRFMTTPSPVAHAKSGTTPQPEFLKNYRKYLDRDQVLDIQELFLDEASQVKKPEAVGPKDIESFSAGAFPLQRTIEKSGNLALVTWLRAHENEYSIFGKVREPISQMLG